MRTSRHSTRSSTESSLSPSLTAKSETTDALVSLDSLDLSTDGNSSGLSPPGSSNESDASASYDPGSAVASSSRSSLKRVGTGPGSTKRAKKSAVAPVEDDEDDDAEEDDVDGSGRPGLTRKLSLRTRNRLKQRAHRERRAQHLSTLESQVGELAALRDRLGQVEQALGATQQMLAAASHQLAQSEAQRMGYEGLIRQLEARERDKDGMMSWLQGEVQRLSGGPPPAVPSPRPSEDGRSQQRQQQQQQQPPLWSQGANGSKAVDRPESSGGPPPWSNAPQQQGAFRMTSYGPPGMAMFSQGPPPFGFPGFFPSQPGFFTGGPQPPQLHHQHAHHHLQSNPPPPPPPPPAPYQQMIPPHLRDRDVKPTLNQASSSVVKKSLLPQIDTAPKDKARDAPSTDRPTDTLSPPSASGSTFSTTLTEASPMDEARTPTAGAHKRGSSNPLLSTLPQLQTAFLTSSSSSSSFPNPSPTALVPSPISTFSYHYSTTSSSHVPPFPPSQQPQPGTAGGWAPSTPSQWGAPQSASGAFYGSWPWANSPGGGGAGGGMMILSPVVDQEGKMNGRPF